jgi:hypothetical protein
MEVPMIVFDGMRHQIDNNEHSNLLNRTACGIDFGDKEWNATQEVPGFCWQCAKVNSLRFEVKMLTKVLEAAIPLQSPSEATASEIVNLAATIAEYFEWRDYQG